MATGEPQPKDENNLSRNQRLNSASSMNILLVEDHEPTRAALSRLLARRQHTVAVAATAREAGLVVDVARPVNFLGAFAWWAAVRKGGAKTPNPRLVSLYDRFVVPVTRAVEKRLPIPFGQSVLCVAHKP